MPKFKWIGLNKEGKKSQGVVEGSDLRDARRILRGMGVRPKKINPPSLLEFDIGEFMVENGLAQAFGVRELTSFTKQLAIMVNAGVPILQSLEILFKGEKNPTLKRAIKQISSDVGSGKTLAEAMRKQKGFNKLYCNLIKAGESGGILDEILKKLAFHMDKAEKTKTQIKSALTYPAIVVTVGFGVIWAMMYFVVPQFVDMIKETGQEMPGITQFVIDMSKWFGANSFNLLIGIVVAAVFLKAYIKTPTGKIGFDRLTMKLPIFGGIIIKGNLSQFTRTLSTMISSGVSLIDSLDICIETIDNTVIANDLKTVRMGVVQGKTLTEPLGKITYFPDMVGQMLKVGEQTGEMDNMLEKISDVFEEQVSTLIETGTKLIEPIIIVVLGGLIALIMVAMYLPVFMSAGGAG